MSGTRCTAWLTSTGRRAALGGGFRLVPAAPRGSSHPSFVPPRKYAPVCGACKLPIIPSEDQDTYKIECLGRSFHESCYRCEVRPQGREGGAKHKWGCPDASAKHPRLVLDTRWVWGESRARWRSVLHAMQRGAQLWPLRPCSSAELWDTPVAGADGGWVLPPGPAPPLQVLPRPPAERVVLLKNPACSTMYAQGAAGPAFCHHNVPGPCPSALFPTACCEQKKPWKSSSGGRAEVSLAFF